MSEVICTTATNWNAWIKAGIILVCGGLALYYLREGIRKIRTYEGKPLNYAEKGWIFPKHRHNSS